jgi:hypothetical protein
MSAVAGCSSKREMGVPGREEGSNRFSLDQLFVARLLLRLPSTATSDAVTTRTRPNVNADRDKDDEALHERLVEGIDIKQVEAVSD